MARPAQPAELLSPAQAQSVALRYAAERRRQMWALWAFAVIALLAAVFVAGGRNVFLPGWWRIDLP